LLPDPRKKPPLLEELTASDKEAIEKMIHKEFKDKAFEDLFVKYYKNATASVYRNMFTRKSLWQDGVSVKV
jgi:hypothetical protein